MATRRPRRITRYKFTQKDDEIIKNCVEHNAHNLQEAFIQASCIIKKTNAQSICQRYYRLRGDWRTLHALVDNNKTTYINTKNVDRHGKFRNDIKTSERKISLIGCTLSKTFKSA